MRRVAVAALSALLLGGLPAAALTPSAESPPGSPGAAPPASAASASGPATHTVTLITGDRVAISGSGDARALTSIAAPRPDGRTVTFHSIRRGDAHYVFPSDVAPLVGDTLDLALFDVAGLVKAGYDDAALAASGGTSLPVIVQLTQKMARTADAADWAALGFTSERTLQSTGAVAGSVDVATGDGDKPAKAWGLLRAVGAESASADEARAKARSGITKVWLGGRAGDSLERATKALTHTNTGAAEQTFNLTINATDVDGSPAENDGDGFAIVGIDDPTFVTLTQFDHNGKSQSQVPAGRYTIGGFAQMRDEVGIPLSIMSAAFPLVDVTKDTTLTIDGEAAQPVTFDTARETDAGETCMVMSFAIDDMGVGHSFNGDFGDLYSLPVPKPAEGDFYQTWAAQLDEKILDVRAGDLALDLTTLATDEPVTGAFEVPLVDAGLGEDFSGASGSWAFVEHAGRDTLQGVADAAAAAGVEALLVAGSARGRVDDWVRTAPLPVFGVPAAQAESLRAAFDAGPVQLSVAGKAAPSYSYALGFMRENAVPDEPVAYFADKRNTGSVRVSVTAPAPGASPYVGGWVYVGHTGTLVFKRVPAPHTRTVFVSADEKVEYSPGASVTEEENALEGLFDGRRRSYAPGEKATDRLLAPVFHGSGGRAQRTGNAMLVSTPAYVDDAGHSIWGLPGQGARTRMKLWAGKKLVADSATLTEVYAEGLPAARTPYRLRLRTAYSGDWWLTSTDVTTEWRFRSAGAGAEERVSLPLLQVDYGVPAALDGLVDRTAKLTLSADHQPGVEGGDVTGMRLWASSDDGENWQKVTLKPGKGGTFLAVVKAAAGAQFVSLRAQADDADGGRVTETVIRAYRLEPAS